MAKDSGKTEGVIGLPPGTKVGKYEIRERMAMGGQAIIYKAYDALLDRHVAIKQISSHLAEDAKFMDRFRKEAQILARLGAEQASIVTIHELIEDQRGLFIIMDYVEGRNLEAILADGDGPVEMKATLRVLWRLAAALHVVHSAGVIHRDIKPSNVIVKDGLWPTIMDFGVAATESGQTSMVLGTTKYMAPELFGSGDIDGRADMYSLGFIVYEMLVGRAKFNQIFADVVRDPRSSTVRWMKWHGNKSVAAPAPIEVNPLVPQALSDIVAKMMAKDRDGRFENMESLGRAIKSAFSARGKAIGAAIGTPSRTPAGAAAAGAAGAAADGGGVNDSTLEGADGLDSTVFEDSEPTARLPKSSLSTRTKIILGAVIFVSIVALGVGYGVRKAGEQRAQRSRLDKLYKSAMSYYDEGNYQGAVDAFDKLLAGKEFANTVKSAKSAVLREVAHGEAKLLTGDWSGAQESENNAKAKLDGIGSLSVGNDISSDWRDGASKDIASLRTHRIDVQVFEKAMAKAADGFKAKHYDLALDRLSGDLIGTMLDPTQKARLAKMVGDIRHDRFIAAYTEKVETSEELSSQGKLEDARKVYAEALKSLEGSEGQQSLSQSERKALEAVLTAKIDDILGEQAYFAAMSEVAVARQKADKAAEIQAWRKVIKARPSARKDANARIVELELDVLIGEAQSLAARGLMQQAVAKIEACVKRDPQNARAAAALASLKAKQEFVQLVAQGDADMGAMQWAQAMEKYQAAGELSTIDQKGRDALKAKVRDCSYQLALSEGDRLRSEKKYSLALKQYELAIGYKSSSEAMVQIRIDDMERDRSYEGFVVNAKAALAREQFTNALKWLHQAEKLKEGSAEVKGLFQDTRYAQQYKNGKDALARGELRVAKAHFVAAKSVKSTPEIIKSIKEVEEKIEEQKEQED